MNRLFSVLTFYRNRIVALLLALLMPLAAKIDFSKYYEPYRAAFPQGAYRQRIGNCFTISPVPQKN